MFRLLSMLCVCVGVCVRERWEVSGGGLYKTGATPGGGGWKSGWISLAAFLFWSYSHIEFSWNGVFYCSLHPVDRLVFPRGCWFHVMIVRQHFCHHLYFTRRRWREDVYSWLHWENEVRGAGNGGRAQMWEALVATPWQKGSRVAFEFVALPLILYRSR